MSVFLSLEMRTMSRGLCLNFKYPHVLNLNTIVEIKIIRILNTNYSPEASYAFFSFP